MARCASSAIVLLAVVALSAGAALALRGDALVKDEGHLESEQAALPPKTPELIAEILGLKDIHKVSLKDVLGELEEKHHLPAQVLRDHKAKIKELTVRELNRLEKEAETHWQGLGASCRGGGFWDFSRQGTCEQTNLKCYSIFGGDLVGSGVEGKCKLPQHGRCYQDRAGDGDSGGCVWPLTCRSFRFFSQQGDLLPQHFGLHYGTTDLKVKSYCVDRNSVDDNNLKFLSYFHMVGTEYFVGERVYKTD